MRGLALLLLVLVAGCSTAPLADMLDYWRPGRIRSDGGQFYGGVCSPMAPRTPGPAPGQVITVPPPTDRLVPTPSPPPPAGPAPGGPPPPLFPGTTP